MLEVAVSTSGTSLVTSTVVEAEPVSSFKLISSTWSTSRVTSAAADLKPCCFTSTWYFPIGKALMTYSPVAPVVAVTTRPVAASVTVTVALATKAPAGSVMVPTIRAVSDCASATPARYSTRTRAAKILRCMFPPNVLATSGGVGSLSTLTPLVENVCKFWYKVFPPARFTRFYTVTGVKSPLLHQHTTSVTSVLDGCHTHICGWAGTVLPTNR